MASEKKHTEAEVDLFELCRRRALTEQIDSWAAQPDITPEEELPPVPPPVMPVMPAPSAPPVRRTAVRRRRKRRNFWKFAKNLLIAAAVCGIIVTVLVDRMLNRVQYRWVSTVWSDVRAEAAPEWPLRAESGLTNLLLLGIDGDGGENQRSDTIMILTLDHNTQTIKLTSVLRDTYVWIPGRDTKTRINHAYAYGGAALTMRTLESNFRLDLDRYVGIDMEGLTVLADGLGGVDITLTQKEADTINKHVKNSSLTAGMQHLNGAQATYYARIRKIDSDFGRTARQRTLIKAMLKRLRTRNPLEQYTLVSQAAPYITTNLTKTEMLQVALQAAGMLRAEPQEMCVPVQDAYQTRTISRMAVLVPDLPANCREMHRFIFGSVPD